MNIKTKSKKFPLKSDFRKCYRRAMKRVPHGPMDVPCDRQLLGVALASRRRLTRPTGQEVCLLPGAFRACVLTAPSPQRADRVRRSGESRQPGKRGERRGAPAGAGPGRVAALVQAVVPVCGVGAGVAPRLGDLTTGGRGRVALSGRPPARTAVLCPWLSSFVHVRLGHLQPHLSLRGVKGGPARPG